MNVFRYVFASVAVLWQWVCCIRREVHAENRVWFWYQGQPWRQQGQFWVKHPELPDDKPLRSGIFLSFEQALKAEKFLRAHGIITKKEGKFLLSKAVSLPLFTRQHHTISFCKRGVVNLDEVFRESQKFARQETWPKKGIGGKPT